MALILFHIYQTAVMLLQWNKPWSRLKLLEFKICLRILQNFFLVWILYLIFKFWPFKQDLSGNLSNNLNLELENFIQKFEILSELKFIFYPAQILFHWFPTTCSWFYIFLALPLRQPATVRTWFKHHDIKKWQLAFFSFLFFIISLQSFLPLGFVQSTI